MDYLCRHLLNLESISKRIKNYIKKIKKTINKLRLLMKEGC